MTNCPPVATLRLIGTEALGEATFADMEAHVEQCPDCQKVLEAWTQADPLATQPAKPRHAPPVLPGLTIERELGRGGASVVYLAWEPVLKRHVAVKLIPRNSLVDRHAREHWLAEARALSRVPHDQVVAIHRVDENDEWLWIVLEYVPGGTLKERLAEPLLPRDAARLMESIARAVGHFHGRGVWHLDLKPSNILLDGKPGAEWENVSPRISDFGIARLDGEPGTTETGANGPKGTPSYMAPEQVAAIPGSIGPAADLHALGALLYHLLTGRPPFQGASSADTLEQVRNQEPVPPRRLNGRIPRDLETICLKCLEKTPSRRYKSALDLADDLRLWLEGHAIKARRVSPLGHAWRWCRRHPAVAGLLVTLGITLTTGVVGLFVLLSQVKAERAQVTAEQMRVAESRRRTEADEQYLASSAAELRSLVTTAVHMYAAATAAKVQPPDATAAHNVSARSDVMKATLFRLRHYVDELKRRGDVPLTTLGSLEFELGNSMMSLNEPVEARGLLNQAAADLKPFFEKAPEDDELWHYVGHALFYSGRLAREADDLSDALKYFSQLIALKNKFVRDYWADEIPRYLDQQMRDLVVRFGRSGRTVEETHTRQLQKQILRILCGLEDDDSTVEPVIGLETLRRLFGSDVLKKMASHESKSVRDNYERFVTRWLAISVESLAPFSSPSSLALDHPDQEPDATSVISVLQDRCSKLGLPRAMVPATVMILTESAWFKAMEQRKAGRLNDARATAALLMAFAQRLVREYPDDARSYELLSDAHDQVKKNAVRTKDDKLIVESLIQSIEASQRSLALDPDQLLVQRRFQKLTAQLARFKANRAAAGSSRP